MFRKNLLKSIICLLPMQIYSQFGIGTTTINNAVILQVESKPGSTSPVIGGFLAPRVALTSRNTFLPVTGTPTNALIVFNTNSAGIGTNAVSPGFYFWTISTGTWMRIGDPNYKQTALFSNQDTTTNLNDGSTFADLFTNVKFNNNPTLYEKVNSTTLRINETGVYLVSLNLDLTNGGGTSDNFGMDIYINNIGNVVSDKIYIPGRQTANASVGKSCSMIVPINNAGSTLRIRAYEIDPNTSVSFKNANTSTISIEKLR